MMRLGGAKNAKPLLVWQELLPSFPDVTVQMVRWHLQRHRMKPQAGNACMERGPIQQEKLTESTLEEDDDQKEEEEEVVNVRQQQQRQRMWWVQ